MTDKNNFSDERISRIELSNVIGGNLRCTCGHGYWYAGIFTTNTPEYAHIR